MTMRVRVQTMSILATIAACRPAPASEPSVAPVDQGPPATTAPAFDCGPEVRGAAALTGPGSVLLVGEMHGTTQVPEVVGRVACHAARAPEAEVILGLELPSDEQPAVDAYLASDGGEAAVASLLAAPHFASEMKDGRSSQAMQALLEAVRGWRAAGAPIEVLCFDVAANAAKTAAERDAGMARTLLAARRARASSTLVTLSGNVHNRTVPGVPWDAAFVPMGVHVREAIPQLVSLDFRSAGGTFWACMGTPSGESQCGVAHSQGEDRGAEPFAELHAARDDKGFDGVLYVGPTTASEPAVPVSAAR